MNATPSTPPAAIRFGIGFKIGIMATMLVVLSASFIGIRFYHDSKLVLIDHELTDLRDESKLRSREFLQEIHSLQGDALQVGGHPKLQAYTRAASSSDGVDPVTRYTLDELRQEVLSLFTEMAGKQEYYQINLLQNENNEGVRELIRVRYDEDQQKAVEEVTSPNGTEEFYRELRDRRNTKLQPQTVYYSRIELSEKNVQRGSGAVPVLRAAVPLFVHVPNPEGMQASPVPEFFGAVVISMNFRKTIKKELTRSPRHVVIMTDEKGEVLVHPNSKTEFTRDKGDEPTTLFDLAGFSPEGQAEDVSAALAELQKSYQQGGTEGDDELSTRGLQIGTTKNGLRLDDFYLLYVRPKENLSEQQERQLLQSFQELATRFEQAGQEEDDPMFLVDPPQTITPKALRLRVRTRSAALLSRLEKEIKEKLTKEQQDQVNFQGPMHCETFAMQYYRLYFDPVDPERYLGLLTAVSYEEVEADLVKQAGKIRKWVLWLIAVGAGLAFLFSRLLTKPLQLITRASREFADGRIETEVPVAALKKRDEIGKLASTFQHMMHQVKERGEALQEKEARIRAIVDAAAEGIMTIDEAGTITAFNNAGLQIFGYQAEEIVGQHFSVLYPAEYGQTFTAYLKQYLATGQSRMLGKTAEAVGARSNGEEFPMELAISEVLVGTRRIFTTIFRDITERKQSEQEIHNLNEELKELAEGLEQRVKERTAELEVATERALEASSAKDRFLANMSHELRTPLNAIIGFSEMLQEETEDMGLEEFHTDLGKIRSAGNHLLALINEILDLAKIEAGKMDLYLEEIEICALVHEVSETLSYSAQKQSNVLQIDCPDGLGFMNVDRTKLRQVLYNLLSNACKFTNHGKVSIDVRRVTNGREMIEFQVKDTGTGIPEHKLDDIFNEFIQADDSTSRKYGGTGLGLAITRKFSELMGGTVTVASKEGEGSTFTVTIPAEVTRADAAAYSEARMSIQRPVPRTPRKSPTALTETGELKTVLVIDDDPTVCELMKRFLGKEGFQVETAQSGARGVELAKELKPMVITLDVAMPEMDGWQVLSKLKDDPETSKIPVIMVTMVDDRSRGYALGAAEYINKPIDWERLIPMLQETVSHNEAATILVIDDDADFRESVCDTLIKEGWQVAQADNGQQGIEHLQQETPALVLLDLLMPEMDGIEFLNKLREREDWRQIPVIMMTGIDPLMKCSPEERVQLKNNVEQVLLKGSHSREDLLQEVYHRVVACAPSVR